MRQIALREPRATYCSMTRHLLREGWKINLKRMHRLWKQEGLRVPVQTRKRRRLDERANGMQRRRAERINQVWSYDFSFDQTEDGDRLKWMPVLDEYTRELAKSVKNSLEKSGMRTLYMEPGSPWQNASSESFNARFRDEFLNIEWFGSQLETKVLGREHRDKMHRD